MSTRPVKVLIVDDSAVVRQVMGQLLGSDPGLQVIGAASDPVFAMAQMARQWPDVIVLDVEMPRMDGLTFLRKLMAERPTPVVICSTLTVAGATTTMQALACGAVSIVAKPQASLKQYLQAGADDLIAVVRAAAKARVHKLLPAPPPLQARPELVADAILPWDGVSRALAETTDTVVAIGTSTGGTQALEHILRALPRVCTGLVIVQHMPAQFTLAFAQRLNELCEVEVREARHGDRVQAGLALIAPGGRHMVLERSGAQYRVAIVDGPPVSRHRPSVDVLFRSVARHAGPNALGIILTGMGDDGAKGLKEMRQAGAQTLAQDEDSCVVYGMPREAVKLGAAQRQVPLQEVASAIVSMRCRSAGASPHQP